MQDNIIYLRRIIMACLTIHYVIAQTYAQKHNIQNLADFITYNFIPDFEDKEAKHFTSPFDKKSYLDFRTNKVNLFAFTQNFTLDNDQNKGHFLHILVDHLFYHDYCYELYKRYDDFTDTYVYLSREYNKLNKPMFDTFDIDLKLVPEKYHKYFALSKDLPNHFNIKDIVKFVDFCSTLDLDEQYENIKQGILPVFYLN